MQNIYVFVCFLEQTKTKAEIKQNSRGWVATLPLTMICGFLTSQGPFVWIISQGAH